MIEQEAIDQNYTMAMQEAPEVFARVSMLYIDTEVGSHRRPRGMYVCRKPHPGSVGRLWRLN